MHRLAVLPLVYITLYITYQMLLQVGLLQHLSSLHVPEVYNSARYFTPCLLTTVVATVVTDRDDFPDRVACPEQCTSQFCYLLCYSHFNSGSVHAICLYF